MASPPTKKFRTVARQEQRFVQQLATGIQTQTARQKSENIDYVLKTLQDHPDDSLAEAVAKMLRNGSLQRAAAASTREEFSPWGKELSLSVKKFKHIPATMCAAILRKLEPGAYSDISWDEPPLNNAAVLRQRVVFAICASEEDTLPTQHLCFRFEKGLLEYCLARYTQAGSRLKTLAPTASDAYYELSGNTVKVLAPLMDETATKIVQLAGLDSATDWVIENNISCKAELVSAQMGERKTLANKFIDINSGKNVSIPRATR